MKRQAAPPEQNLGSIRPVALFQQIDGIAEYFLANAQHIDSGVLLDARAKLHNAADRIDRIIKLNY